MERSADENESRFDTRTVNYTEKIPVARCVIGGENLPDNSAQMVKFIVGNSTYDSDFIDGEHILKIIPTRHFDKESNLLNRNTESIKKRYMVNRDTTVNSI